MGVIGEIQVNVSADTKQYSSGLSDAEKATKRFEKVVAKSNVAMRNLDGRLVTAAKGAMKFARSGGIAAAAAAGLAFKFKTMADAQKQLQLRSDQFGVDPRRLKALTHTLEDMGVQADSTIDAVQTILERVEEARKGEGTAVEVFESLRINVEKFANLDVTAKFERLAVAFSQVDDSAKRTLATTDLFGDEAATIAGAFKDSAKFSKELKENLATAKVDPAVTKAGEKLNKATNRISRSLNSFLVDFAPLVEKVADAVEYLRRRDDDKPPIQLMTKERVDRYKAAGNQLSDFIDRRRRQQQQRDIERAAPSAFGKSGFAMGEFKINAGIESAIPGGHSPATRKNVAESKQRMERQSAQRSVMKLAGLGKSIASALGPVMSSLVSKVGSIEFPVGPAAAIQESNAALTKGSAAAFSAINRAASPEMKLDEQRNMKLDRLIENGAQILAKIGGAGQTILDTVTF